MDAPAFFSHGVLALGFVPQEFFEPGYARVWHCMLHALWLQGSYAGIFLCFSTMYDTLHVRGRFVGPHLKISDDVHGS